MSLDNQANVQSAMGQHAEALASVNEAVRIRLALVDANRDEFLPDLAGSLNNQADTQSAMGQHAEALASVAEAVRHYRALANANPDSFLPDLAMSLCVLGNCLAALERLSEARAAAAEALALLAPFCARFPGVFDDLAKVTVRDYWLRTKELGEEPDMELLLPYMHLFEPGEPND
jgi:tetratricopeptide (TPR) repeat protein